MPEPRHQHHVFVVDDEPIIASTLAMILSIHGFDVRFFIEPLEALQAVLAQPPDLLLTDVVMPLLSGIELAIRAREHSPHCDVLLFSGHTVAADLHEAAMARAGFRVSLQAGSPQRCFEEGLRDARARPTKPSELTA